MGGGVYVAAVAASSRSGPPRRVSIADEARILVGVALPRGAPRRPPRDRARRAAGAREDREHRLGEAGGVARLEELARDAGHDDLLQSSDRARRRWAGRAPRARAAIALPEIARYGRTRTSQADSQRSISSSATYSSLRRIARRTGLVLALRERRGRRETPPPRWRFARRPPATMRGAASRGARLPCSAGRDRGRGASGPSRETEAPAGRLAIRSGHRTAGKGQDATGGRGQGGARAGRAASASARRTRRRKEAPGERAAVSAAPS